MPIRFATDSFGSAQEFIEEDIQNPDAPDTPSSSFMKTAFLKSKVPLDCSNFSSVDSFVITGNEPAGSSRRIIFLIDGNLFHFQNNALVPYTEAGDFADVIKYGNKPSTLLAQSDLSAFVGKQIYPIIALQAPFDANEFPSIKLALSVRSASEQLSNTQYSPIYILADDTQSIIDIAADVQTQGSGEVDIAVQLRANGSWSSYTPLTNAANKSADAVRFRFIYRVANIGSDSACVKSITVRHTAGQAVVSIDDCNLYSAVANYDAGLKTAYCLVHHAPLVDAKIEAYVNFSPAPSKRELVQIGTATGSRQELSLPDLNVVANSIKLFQDGNPFYNFDFSTETSTVSFTARQNAVITASYDYGYGQENWLEMIAANPQPYNDDIGSYSTRFSYVHDEEDLSVANVRIRLRRLSGTATENLGNATGKTQLFNLKHKPKPSTIRFDRSVSFSFDDDNGILSCVAAKNTPLNISYQWLGDAPVVYSFAAGFSV